MTGNQYDLIVVGAGPVDMWLQYVQPSLALIQQLSKKNIWGICLNWGCIPTKALLSGADLAYQLKHAGNFGFTLPQIDFDLSQLVKHSRQVSQQLVQGIEHLLKKMV